VNIGVARLAGPYQRSNRSQAHQISATGTNASVNT
jgi:hypothetical protein